MTVSRRHLQRLQLHSLQLLAGSEIKYLSLAANKAV